jgi:hypothetical protein
MRDKKAIAAGIVLVIAGAICWMESMPYQEKLKELRSQDSDYALKGDIGHNDVAEIDAGGRSEQWRVAAVVTGAMGVVVALYGTFRKKAAVQDTK